MSMGEHEAPRWTYSDQKALTSSGNILPHVAEAYVGTIFSMRPSKRVRHCCLTVRVLAHKGQSRGNSNTTNATGGELNP